MRVHLYVADVTTPPDHRGDRPCLECPLPKANQCHKVRERSDEERALEARWIGEEQER